MPRGEKDAYTDKQKRKAEHIEEGYEKKGVSKDEAEAQLAENRTVVHRAWKLHYDHCRHSLANAFYQAGTFIRDSSRRGMRRYSRSF